MAQTWQPASSGGYLASPYLSRKLRHVAQPLMRFRQYVRPEPGFGRKKGDTVLFDRISNVTTPGRKISELERMPETSVTISQGSVVVEEYGNAIPWTGKLEELAEFDVENIWLRTLRDDAAKTLDKEVGKTFTSAPLKATPTGTNGATTTFTESGSPPAATGHVSATTVKDIVDEMKSKYLVPFYDGENYLCICSVKFGRRLKDDPDWEDASKYGDPERLFSGEIGRYYGVRFVEETNVLSNVLGTTSYNGEAVFFGADPVVEAVVVPLEIRAKVPTDYGRDNGLAWYYMGGWALTWPSSVPGEAKIVHVTSS